MDLRRRLYTACIAAIGVALFLWLKLPLPFLLGPMFLCLAFALGGASMAGMGVLGTAFRTILGVAAGSSITPQAIAAVPDLLLSLVFIPVFVATVALVSFPLMRRVFGFDRVTSYFCAMPGGLQDLVVFGEA
ncbi:MAG: AbrB family transcriptional regulator, partial [Leisingera sp.]